MVSTNLPGPMDSNLSAAEVISRVLQKYAHIPNYQDQGDAIVLDQGSGSTSSEVVARASFTTAFMRPDRFVLGYELTVGGKPWSGFQDSVVKGAIWQNGREWRERRTDSTMKTGNSEFGSMAFGRLFAASRFAVPPTIPWMLHIDGVFLPSARLVAVKLIGLAIFDHQECVIVECTFGNGAPFFLWIDKASELVVHMEDREILGGPLKPAIIDEIARGKLARGYESKNEPTGVPPKAQPYFERKRLITWRPTIDANMDPSVFDFGSL